MDIIDEIFENAKIFSEVSEEKEPALRLMCSSAHEALSARFCEGIDLAVVHDAYVRGAGLYAASMLVGIDSSDVESFSAGKLSVHKRAAWAAKSSATAMRRQAELMLRGIIEPENFVFRAVDE